MTLTQAQPTAERLKEMLSPFCDRIEIAGSIRRRRETCNDIDLVVLPKPGMDAALRERIHAKTKPITEGPKNLSVVLDWQPSQAHRCGVRLDIYFAHNGEGDLLDTEPSNFGSVLLCRTGSVEHNVYLCKVATGRGYKWEVMRGVTENGKVIASETEEAIFKALGLEWIEPERRER